MGILTIKPDATIIKVIYDKYRIHASVDVASHVRLIE